MNSDFTVAVHALVCLAHKGESLSSETLAESICTNPARVRKVTARLKKAGLLTTKEGSVGGCRLALSPEELDLARVASALEVTFVEAAWHSGAPDRDCPICTGMAGAMDDLFAQLDGLCKQYLSRLTIADLERRLFAGKGG